MNTYKIEMTDGKRWDREGLCAVDAIARALEDNPGQTVTRCWRGGERRGDARTEYDVPHHTPALPKQTRAKAEPQPLLFDEEESARLGLIRRAK